MTATLATPTPTGDTLTVLAAEFASRGFDYLATSRQYQMINWAHQELCALYPWPFLEAEATTLVSGDSIANLGSVLSVMDTATGLSLGWIDRRALADYDLLPTTTGDASVYYLFGNAVYTYPVDAGPFTVHYLHAPPALGAGDAAFVPQMWSDLLVDCAVLKGLKDDDGDRSMLKAEVDERVVRMIAFYDRGSGPDIVPFSAADIGAGY